jgi:CRP-like cAMP-binding protein
MNLVDRRAYGPGSVIIREGDSGDSFYLIETGQVGIWKKTATGSVMLGQIGPGGIFGEMALIDDRPRMASVTAIELTTCKVFPRGFLERKLARADPLIQAIVKIFAQNIRSITDLQMRHDAGDQPDKPSE